MSGYTTGTGNELTSGGGYTFTYDKNGNTVGETQLSTGDVWTFGYDDRNRMISAVEKNSGGTTLNQATYTYDALDRRIGFDDNGTQTWTVYNGSSADANPYADFNGSGTLLTRYVSGLAVDETLRPHQFRRHNRLVPDRPAGLGARHCQLVGDGDRPHRL